MKERKKYWKSDVIFIGILVLLFWVVQKTSIYVQGDYVDTLSGFYDLDEDSIQIGVLGSSHAFYSIIPERLYENQFISAYDLASPGADIGVAYYMAKELMKQQNPEILVLDACSIFEVNWDANYRYVLDTMPFSANKLRMSYKYSECKNNKAEAFMSAIFPIYYYHQRYKEIGSTDFDKHYGTDNYYTKGYWTTTPYRNFDYTQEQMESEVVAIRAVSEDLYAPTISEENLSYFAGLKQLCDENDVALLVIKVPVVASYLSYNSAWTTEKSAIIRNLCAEYGVDYLDLQYDVDLGLDYKYDYCDWGHTNYSGACKVTDFLGDYLVEHYNIESHFNARYRDDLEVYHQVQYAAELELTHDFSEYMQWLIEHKEDCTILITASDECVSGLSDADKAQLAALGLQQDFSMGYYHNSYLAVIDGGEVIKETMSPYKVTDSYVLDNGDVVSLTSSGWAAGAASNCIIDGVDYSVHGRGLNIVVYDKASQLFIDSVALDTYDATAHSVTHTYSQTFFNQYEEYVLQ